MGYLSSGVRTTGIPIGIVEALLDAGHQVRTLVETGSAGGQSMKDAAQLFDRCYTIEIREGAYSQSLGNTTAITGDSVKELPEIITKLKGYTLFYLDAHYSGDEKSPHGTVECPLMDEIRIISRYEQSLIIIDDARLFYGPPPAPLDPRQWPGISEIFEELRKGFPWHYITIRDDYVLCLPIHFKIPIDKEWRDRFRIRYPNENEKLRTSAKMAYEYFQKWVEI